MSIACAICVSFRGRCEKMTEKLPITLRPLCMDDAPALAWAMDNLRVQENLRDGIPYPYTEKDAAEFISKTLAATPDTQYLHVICYEDNYVGGISVMRRENIHRLTAEIGYHLAEPFWGRGIITEAIRKMCAYIFENTDIVRIFAEPFTHNVASCRALEKVGFQFEGVMRQNAIKNGQFLDMRLYAILKSDWKATLR